MQKFLAWGAIGCFIMTGVALALRNDNLAVLFVLLFWVFVGYALIVKFFRWLAR